MKATAQENQELQLQANLERILFKNDEDGFLIGRFYDNGKFFTAKGYLHKPREDMAYTLIGTWKQNTNPKYPGQFFGFRAYEFDLPTDSWGIESFLRKYIRGVGPFLAGQIVEAFGEDTLEVLRAKPKLVADTIPRMSIDVARDIAEQMEETYRQAKLIVKLEAIVGGLKLPKNTAMKLVERYGYDAIDKVKDDPYETLQIVRGIGFANADKVALTRLNFDFNDKKRIFAAFQYVMRLNEKSGNTWIREPMLLKMCYEACQVPVTSTNIPSDFERRDEYLAITATAIDEKIIEAKLKVLLNRRI